MGPQHKNNPKNMKVAAATRRYLSEIGRRGGQISRRSLTAEQARNMVQLREARRLFRLHHGRCFWSYRPDLVVGLDDIHWVAAQLKKYGDRKLWIKAQRLLCQ